MPDITIPALAMVKSITLHAIRRYTERCQILPCFIIDDLTGARPLTKGRMKKLNLDRRRGYLYLRTHDGLIFVIAFGSVITCYYEKTNKASVHDQPDTEAERGRYAPRRPRRSPGAGRQSQSRPSLMAEFRRISL